MKSLSTRIATRGFCVIVLLFALSVRCQIPPSAASAGAAVPFSSGEDLTFDLSWDIFTAGQIAATISRVPDAPGDSYRITATAKSRGFVSLLYPVEDQYESFVNPQTLCSQRLTKKVNEGRRHKDTTIVFDSRRKLAILDERDLAHPSLPPKHDEQAIPPCVEDVISAFYDIRRQPLKVGQVIGLPVNDGSKTTAVRVEVQALESIKVPFGQRMAYRLEPTVFGRLLKRQGRMLIWISDDPQRLPLRIKAMIAVGTITAELRSVGKAEAAGATPQPHPSNP